MLSQYRRVHAGLLGLCLCVLMGSFYLEWVQGWAMCPLCLLQRWSWMAMACAFVCALHAKWSAWAWKSAWVCCSVGLCFTLRHIWLQYFVVDTMTTCLPPVMDGVWWQTWWQASDDCHLQNYLLFGWTLSVWSLLGQLSVILGLWFGARLKRGEVGLVKE